MHKSIVVISKKKVFNQPNNDQEKMLQTRYFLADQG